MINVYNFHLKIHLYVYCCIIKLVTLTYFPKKKKKNVGTIKKSIKLYKLN